jgi:hypothetical protein
MNRRIKSMLIASLAVLLCATFAAAAQQQHQRTRIVDDRDNQWTWKWTDNGISLEMKAQGKVEFNEDYTDVVRISPGGSLRIKDERGGATRQIEITPSSNGGLDRAYSVRGQARPYDDEARAWLSRILTDATRQAGLDAGPRARKILSQRGPGGLLDEVSQLHSDYVKKLYLEELIKSGALDAQTTRRLLTQVAREMSSDYEKAVTLIQVSETPLGRDDWHTAYIEATRSIHSDYERKRALTALLNRGDLSREAVLLAIKSASEISSDYEKVETLIKVSQNPPGKDGWRAAYIEATRSIQSDYEHARALSALINKGELSREVLLLVVNSATGISSDYEKARVLMLVVSVSGGDQGVRDAVIEAAKTLGSDYERGRVLKAATR